MGLIEGGSVRHSQDGLTPLALVVVVAVLIVVVTAFVLILVLPIKPVDIHQEREVPAQSGVTNIDMDLVGKIGTVEVTFDNLGDRFLTLDVWVTGAVGIFNDPGSYNLTFDYLFAGDTLEVEVDIEPTDMFSGINFLIVDCEVVVSDLLRTGLDISVNTGSVTVETLQFVNLTRMDLNTNTGSVEAHLSSGTTLWDDISIWTNTGSVNLQWEDVSLMQNISISLATNTGSVNVDARQTVPLSHEIDVLGETHTGSVSTDMMIVGNISATIDWDIGTGGVDIERQIGFSRDGNHMQSANYPAEENISISIATTTGGVDIWAEWTA